MKAMVLYKLASLEDNPDPLRLVDVPIPIPELGEVLIRVSVCGVCHTELDEIEGRTPPSQLPVIPGHQVIGIIEQIGWDQSIYKVGDRVGVAWIYASCGKCNFCISGEENLCDHFIATGRDVNGGYAEYMLANERYIYHIPNNLKDAEAAPLLCAGAIGYRALVLSGIKNNQKLGLSGFGASGHLTLMMTKHLYPQTKIYVHARDKIQRDFAKSMGAEWCGDLEDQSPDKLNAIIDTTPAWKPVVTSMANLQKGGRLIINAIRKQELDKNYLLKLSYHEHLWMEKEIKSVANITRNDVMEFLELANKADVKPRYQLYPLDKANGALHELKKGSVRGAKVLQISR